MPPAGVTIVLAHGAGAGMTHPFLVGCASGLAARGLDAITFNFPYMERRAKAPNPAPQLEACYRALIATLAERGWLAGRRLVIGGKSMGGRMATMVAAGADAGTGRSPIRSPASSRSGIRCIRRDSRTSCGSRTSPRCGRRCWSSRARATTSADPDELAPHLAPLGALATIHPIERGDHSFKVTGLPRGTQGAVLEGILDTVAAWCRALPSPG